MVLATVFNMIVLPWPYQFEEREWVLFRFITPVVDRGIIALLGVVLILGSCWIQAIAQEKPSNAKFHSKLPFWASVVSILFSVFFVMMLGAHLWNLSQWRSEQIASVAEQAAQAESQLEQQVDQQRELIGTLLENTGLREDAISRGQLPGDVVALLEQLENDPGNLSAFEERVQEGLTQRQTDISIRRQDLQKEVSDRATKSALMTGVDSLLLAIGFGIISWTGLRLSK